MKSVTFYSTSFCPTCKFLKPKVQEAYPDTVFDELGEGSKVAEELGIMTVPTIIFREYTLDNGLKELARLSGGITIQQFKETLANVGMV